jgi:hypothetical protein
LVVLIPVHITRVSSFSVDTDVYSLVVPEEMDWDKNGTVTFKEFLFAFTRWVGLDENEDDDDDE